MKIEDRIFMRKRFIPEKAEAFGFIRDESGFVYEEDFLDGDFSAEVRISDSGILTGTVFDKMNDEEYALLRAEGVNGAFVNTVRSGYEAVLEKIARECCSEVLFASEQSNRITRLINEKYNISPDFPFGSSAYRLCGVFRHDDNEKWFGLIMNVKRRVLPGVEDDDLTDILNLKIDEERGDEIRSRKGVYPAYHMNHKKWISVVLDDTLSDEDVMDLIDDSFRLTEKKTKKKTEMRKT